MNRRSLLKNISLGAGSVLLSPVLGRLHAYADGRPVTAKRFVFVIESNGLPPDHIAPVGTHRRHRPQAPMTGESPLIDLPLAEQTLPLPLQALEPFKSRMTLVNGLSSRICPGGHSSNFATLACRPVPTGSSNAVGETIDWALSRGLPATFPHVGLGIAMSPEKGIIYNCTASGVGQKQPTICKPDIAYANLFGSVAKGAAQEAFRAHTNLLDFMTEEVRRVERNLSGPEREQMGSYLGALETLHNRQSRIHEAKHILREKAPTFTNKYTSDVETDRLEAHFDLGAAALISGLTNVVTISSGVGDADIYMKFRGLGINVDKHQIGHGASYEGKNADELAMIIRHFHVAQVAGLIRKLESVPEGNGTMMDNTVVVYMSDGAEAHHSRCWEWPMVVIGNAGGRLRAGRYLDYPGYGQRGHRTLANLYMTFLHAAGMPCERFGMPDPVLADFDQKGPLAELIA
ncbi:MAG: hypothetical protein RLZZ399_1326 [Verrucomicrobiota bacterium]|jgi:hypothetical protein